MKLLIENWRKFLNEVVDLQAAQQLIDANPYLQGKLTATPENMIEGEKYILVVSDESLGHIKDRHQNASAPGSLFDPGLNLRSAMQNLLSQNPDEVSGGRVKWLGADAGAQVGKMGVKLASPEEVAKMQDYTMPGGRNEVVKITAGERDSTNQISLITAELGDLSDGRKLLSLITAFPGGTEIDGKEMPFDRNEFAAAGFYFVIPQIQKESIMKTVKLTKAQLRRIIRESRHDLGGPDTDYQRGSHGEYWAQVDRTSPPRSQMPTEAEIDWVQVGPMEVLRMGRDTVTVLDWDASGADDMVTVWHNGKMKKVPKSELSPL